MAHPTPTGARRSGPWQSGALAIAAATATLLLLAIGLPADAFYTGDPGVKLIAARNALERPSAPLEIPFPSIAGDVLPHLDPFFAPHGDHAHAVTSEVFPLATAPFIGLLGKRGAYVLPALGFAMALAGCVWLGVLLDDRRSPAVIVMTATLGTPLLFYGLEFWEHAPAVGAVAWGLALFVSASGRESLAHAASAGALFGLASLLRPEAAWFAIATLVGARWLPWRVKPRLIAVTTAAFVVPLVPLAIYALAHFGTLMTPHIAGNPALWGPGWPARRIELLASWFGSIGPATAWIAAPALIVALAPQLRGGERRGRVFLAVVAAAGAALVWLTAPNDGGGQWGPRYLLAVSVPLTILAADVLHSVTQRRTPLTIAIVVFAVAVGAAVQRMAYQRLRGTKQTYERVLNFIEESAPAGSWLVTDLWWLDQIAAAAADDRTFLFAANSDTGTDLMKRLDRGQAPLVTVVRSREESPDQSAWLDGTCYVEDSRQEIDERALVAVRAVRRCR